MVWAGIATLWAVVALWMLAERAVATGWAYRAVTDYARHRATRHGQPIPELDDGLLVTHASVMQTLPPHVVAELTAAAEATARAHDAAVRAQRAAAIAQLRAAASTPPTVSRSELQDWAMFTHHKAG